MIGYGVERQRYGYAETGQVHGQGGGVPESVTGHVQKGEEYPSDQA